MKSVNFLCLVFAVSLSAAAAAEKPKYDSTSNEVIGKYGTNNEVLVKRFTWSNVFGVTFVDEDITLELTPKNGVLEFSEDVGNEGCDNPGCRSLVAVSGKVVPKKVAEEWVPVVIATFTYNYPYPEFEGDLEGEVVTKVVYSKKQ